MARVRALLAGTGTVAAVGTLLVAGINGGYAVNRTTGTIRRVDGATFEATPPVSPLPETREGLQAFAGTDSLYALDSQRGVLTAADPKTLTNRGAPVPLATQISGQGAALDDAGR